MALDIRTVLVGLIYLLMVVSLILTLVKTNIGIWVLLAYGIISFFLGTFLLKIH